MKIANTWSYSRLKAFETCPRQFYHVKVLREYEEPETEAMRYGNEFHEAAEHYIGSDASLPAKFNFAKPVLDTLKRSPGNKLCEFKMGMTADLEPCAFDDDNVWYRGIVDLNIVDPPKAKVIDYKTGRSAKYADKGQLELMALCTFAHFPEIEDIKAALLFVIANAFITDKYTRDDIPRLWEKWLGKHSRMEQAFKNDVWNANPSGLCRKHCPVTSCAHNGRN